MSLYFNNLTLSSNLSNPSTNTFHRSMINNSSMALVDHSHSGLINQDDYYYPQSTAAPEYQGGNNGSSQAGGTIIMSEVERDTSNGGLVGRNISRDVWQRLIEESTVDMPPPSQVHHVQILAVAGLYFILFMIGICGNTSVLTILSHLNQSLKKAKLSGENTFIYLMALSIVDFCVILSLPIAISDMLLGHWIFGSAICKLYWTLESTGKIMSTFILTAMSFDRYIGVCHPTKTQLRTRRASLTIMLTLVIAALALLSPLTYHANSKIIKQSNPIPDGHGRFVRFTTSKCRVFTMEDVTFVAFTWYIFIVGHLVPAILIGYFYAGMLWTIRVHQRNSMTTSRIKIRRVVLYTLAVCGFYFACWTPYWAGNILYVQLVQEGATDNFVYLMYVIHALPFINSSLNWIFYALLNTQLRRTQQKVNSATKTTNNGNGSIVLIGRTTTNFVSCNNLTLNGIGGRGSGSRDDLNNGAVDGCGGGGGRRGMVAAGERGGHGRLSRNGKSYSKSMRVTSSSTATTTTHSIITSDYNKHLSQRSESGEQSGQQSGQQSPPRTTPPLTGDTIVDFSRLSLTTTTIYGDGGGGGGGLLGDGGLNDIDTDDDRVVPTETTDTTTLLLYGRQQSIVANGGSAENLPLMSREAAAEPEAADLGRAAAIATC